MNRKKSFIFIFFFCLRISLKVELNLAISCSFSFCWRRFVCLFFHLPLTLSLSHRKHKNCDIWEERKIANFKFISEDLKKKNFENSFWFMFCLFSFSQNYLYYFIYLVEFEFVFVSCATKKKILIWLKEKKKIFDLLAFLSHNPKLQPRKWRQSCFWQQTHHQCYHSWSHIEYVMLQVKKKKDEIIFVSSIIVSFLIFIIFSRKSIQCYISRHETF